MTNSSKRSNVLLKVIIVLISILFVAFIWYEKWDQIQESIYENMQKNIETWTNLFINDEISLSGKIADNGDLISFSHTLGTQEYGLLWLKSKKIDLFKYKDNVYIQGIVSDIKNNTPIIEVTSIVSLDTDILSGDISEEDSINSGIVYINNAGLFFEPEFFLTYKILSSDNGEIKIQTNDEKKNITINYFDCNKQISDKNCIALADSFSKSKETSIISPHGIEYFKLIEIKSWFFHNNDLFWYFINDVEKSDVASITKYIQSVNTNYINTKIKENIDILCKDYTLNIATINKYEIYKDWGDLNIKIDWNNDWNTQKLECVLKVNPLLKKWASLISIEETINTDETLETGNSVDINEDSDITDINEVEIINTDFDPNVEQFPVELEKSLKFSSKRWHTIILPSSNLAFQDFWSEEDFDQVWVNCFSRMAVIKYSEKVSLENKSSIDIFECSIKNSFDDSDPTLIYKQVGDRNFIIRINDASWYDFAKNTKIEITNID